MLNKPIGLPRLYSGRKHRRQNHNCAHRQTQILDPELSDAGRDFMYNDDSGRHVVMPRRSMVVSMLSSHLRKLLKNKNISSFISHIDVKLCLGEKKIQFSAKNKEGRYKVEANRI